MTDEKVHNRQESEPVIAMLGGARTMLIDKICAFLLAMAPILQHYYGLYENAGFTVYLMVLPLMLLRFPKKIKARQMFAVLPLLLYELYSLAMRFTTVSRILYSGFLIVMLLCLYNGSVNMDYLLKYAIGIGYVATVLVVVQYVFYYVFHNPVNFEPHSLLLPENSRWLKTASYSAGRLYRPSGFFLEPSHMFLYCFPLIALCLLLPDMNKWRMKRAVILSAGVVLSTSGMGIFIVAGLWILYEVMYKHKIHTLKEAFRKIFTVKNVCIMILMLIILVIMYFVVPFFQQAVNRIFTADVSTNAIAGRTRRVSTFVSGITGKAVLFGEPGITSNLDFNVSGLFSTYIRWGLIGVLLTYWHYCMGLFRLKNAYFWLSFLFVILSYFTAHTHGTFYLVYYASILANGYFEKPYAKRKAMLGDGLDVSARNTLLER